MQRTLLSAIALGLCLVSPPPGYAQDVALARMTPVPLPAAPPQLSRDCRTKKIAGELFRRPLWGVRRAIRERRPIKVLAIGSSSTVGVGASRPTTTYVARLETTLEGVLKGLDFDIVNRGLSGEIAEGQSHRMLAEVEAAKPDLVVWQVGTNDAMRKVSVPTFKSCIKRTLSWLAETRTDVVLVDPQYGSELTRDAHYEQVVAALAEVAREERILLVDRFPAMKEVARERGDYFYLTSDNLHMNDRGHQCLAEQVANAIVAGVLQAEGVDHGTTPPPSPAAEH